MDPSSESKPNPLHVLLVALWSTFCFYSLAWNLGGLPNYHTDEYFYVQSIKNMLDEGDYFTPHYYEKKRFNKPIFIYWLMLLACKMFGTSFFSMRFFSALAGAACIPVAYAIGRRLFDSRTAIYTALILPGVFLIFNTARFARPDMVLTFLIFLSFLFFIRWIQMPEEKVFNISGFYAAAALGFLTKGPAAIFIPALAILLFLLISGKRDLVGKLQPLRGFIIFLLINGPWFTAMLVMYGDEFIGHIVHYEIQDRLTREDPLQLYYFGALLVHSLPWSLFFLSATAWFFGLAPRTGESSAPWLSGIRTAVKNLLQEENHALLFCFIWILTTLTFFTLLRNYHSWYVATAAAPLALVTARFLVELEGGEKGTHSLWFTLPFTLLILLFAGVGIGAAVAIWVCQAYFEVTPAIAILPVLMWVGAAALPILHKHHRSFAVVALTAFIQVAGLGIVCGKGLSFINGYPMKKFTDLILREGKGDEEIHLIQLSNEKAKIGNLTMHWIRATNNADILHHIASLDKKAFVIMRENLWREHYSNLPLKILERDIRIKRIDLDKKTLGEMREKGIRPTLESYFEPVLLLSNR